MPRPVPENRQRRWAPKVRTGCLTCKKRKKRCDEERPICRMCTKGGYKCDGYETNSSIGMIGLAGADDVETPSYSPSPANSGTHHLTPPSYDSANLPSYSSSMGDLCMILSNGQLNASLTASDHRYTQFFIVKVAPVLATTKQWRSFWETTVPCMSTYEPSVYHAMIALSASYESKATGVDCRTVATQQVNLALRAMLTRSEPVVPYNTLILCRLLASISQCNRDWTTAIMHLRHGWNILIQAIRDDQINPADAQLLAPTFLRASSGEVSHLIGKNRRDTDWHRSVDCLENIRSQFMNGVSSSEWTNIDSSKKRFLTASWSVMTQAMCSLICHNNSSSPTEGEDRSIRIIKSDLETSGALLNPDELQKGSNCVGRDLKAYLRKPINDSKAWLVVKSRIQQIVENFLVQAAELQPNMRIGRLWLDDSSLVCDIDRYLCCESIEASASADLTPESYHSSIEDRPPETEYYLEYACPYRSGLMPAFVHSP